LPLNVATAKRNRLLATLPGRDIHHFIGACEPVDLVPGVVLAEPERAFSHAYFPTEGFISQITPAERATIEVALVGNEGMIGIPLALGVPVSAVRAVVQMRGSALRMDAGDFCKELESSADLRKLIGRYAFVVLSQSWRSISCNQFHLVEQRLARWILMSADRAHSFNVAITHRSLALILGVRREGVTAAAATLQRRGLIRCGRGSLDVLDRKGLEQVSCRCYRSDLTNYKKIFG
jgi:CRP-like cAMP-binding protein